MENSKVNFSKSQSLVDFIISLGANTCKIVRNPKTSKRFFVVDGTEVSGRVSTKVEDLSADLRVSWMEPEDGEASYIIHHAGSDDNTESTFSVQ
jgi:hypothetical protein